MFAHPVQVNRWYPLSVVTGGTTAKLMVGAMKNQIGKSMYEGALTRNIAAVMYKVRGRARLEGVEGQWETGERGKTGQTV